MTETSIDTTSQQLRNLFNKGLGAFERGNYDYAIDVFLACLDQEPMLVDVRKFLRAAEIKRFKATNKGPLAHVSSLLLGIPGLIQAYMKIHTGKPMAAVRVCENLLRMDPLNLQFIKLFCMATEAANLPQIAVQTLTMAREQYPANLSLASRLGKVYMALQRAKEARACFEAVIEARPNDGNALRDLKNAMALESMTRDGWYAAETAEGDYHNMLKDAGEAELLEKEAKAVRSEKDIEALIADTLEKIEREPKNVNYHRSLANLYAGAKMFHEAISTLRKAQEIRGTADPELDAVLTKIQIEQFDNEAAELAEAGDEQGAEARRKDRDAFYYSDVQERVRKYPNDLHLRHEYGVSLYGRNMINEAIQQFQSAQRNPRWRISSLYYLGLCFKIKGQYDLAVEQLQKAAAELVSMDDTKKEIYYELGLIHEAMNDPTTAGEYFKNIYQVDISFKDVAQKVESIYSRK